jgi:hypothetical protein
MGFRVKPQALGNILKRISEAWTNGYGSAGEKPDDVRQD